MSWTIYKRRQLAVTLKEAAKGIVHTGGGYIYYLIRVRIACID